ncbi:permease [Isachenkonia alkalipeptolytica]|uniref:Permease n=1 Tax=Isachenkonia alkalipeptolytica TaxID=2565777 RepID=A0AA43XJ78_9CLOT|nr:permease [Isachenkonia alkalipeptolytica]NBG87234.1 permease [Isachenkonia alkalipeptolytica]
MKKVIQRYKFALMLILINIAMLFILPEIGFTSLAYTRDNTLEMLYVVPPIFIILGLLDVWVPRETMMKLMGEKSGSLGKLIAFLMGSLAAGPLYVAFPIAGLLLKKGSKFSNVLIFIGAWSTTKIPLLLFEASALGWTFMLTRFTVNIFVILLIAGITEKLLKAADKTEIYKKADALSS